MQKNYEIGKKVKEVLQEGAKRSQRNRNSNNNSRNTLQSQVDALGNHVVVQDFNLGELNVSREDTKTKCEVTNWLNIHQVVKEEHQTSNM